MKLSLEAALRQRALHACIDMQRLFAEPTEWHTPGLQRILPAVERLCAHAPAETVFTRFVTPHSAEQAHGAWRAYYRHWSALTGEHLAPGMLDLVAPLDRYAPPARVCDKGTHSAFGSGGFPKLVGEAGVGALVLSGVETDVCVLATALDAIDRGLAVVLASDAVAGSVQGSHAAVLEWLYPRFEQQLVLARVEDVLRAWDAHGR